MKYSLTSRPLFATAALSALAVSALALAGCAAQAPPATGEGDGAPTEIAFLSASSANTILSAASGAMDELATAENVKITEFDATFDAATQTAQIQDVLASGRYDGAIVAAIDGTGIIPGIQDMLDAGLEVVVLNQLVGERYDTADVQVEGVAASILTPPTSTGKRLGQLAVQACDGETTCDVAYMFGIKGLIYDEAVRAGFDEVVAAHPNITVVAEVEGGFLGADEPMTAAQDLVQSRTNFDVFVATGDQQARGALLALTDAGLADTKVIGVGASAPALQGIADGTWFGSVAVAPADEGRLALQAMLDAVREGTVTGGIDPVTQLADDGLVTGTNVDKFTAQWNG